MRGIRRAVVVRSRSLKWDVWLHGKKVRSSLSSESDAKAAAFLINSSRIATPPVRILAWRTEALGITSLVLTTSRERARHITAVHAREVGFKVKYFDVRAFRWHHFDDHRWSKTQHHKCLSPG